MGATAGGEVVLGISADFHDAAAAVLVDGEVVAAAAEERFTRRKHDPDLPRHAIAWCLDEAGVGPDGPDHVVFHDEPLLVYDRILSTHATEGPRGLPTLTRAIGRWSTSKLWVGLRVEQLLRAQGRRSPRLRYAGHHASHAAAAYHPSPFDEAAVLTFDGVGDWATTTIAHGRGAELEVLAETRYPHSIGLFYSAMTAWCGFEVNDGEYKLMGLAPYGRPTYVDRLRDQVIRVAEDGSIWLDQRWFRYQSGPSMTHPALARLLDGPPRDPAVAPGQREADLARSVQVIVEDAVLAIARHAHERTGARRACLAGGVALNCVANARLRDEGPFDELWVQPAAGDDGAALGAALWAWHQQLGRPRRARAGADAMRGARLGPSFAPVEVADWLASSGVEHRSTADDAELAAAVAERIADGAIVGWFQGAMEFGPRALGGRSILADPRDPEVVRRINLAVKGREGFRPFAPAVLATEADRWFEVAGPSPYMTFTVPVRGAVAPPAEGELADRLAAVRSPLPAITHVDGSARIQTVDETTDPRFAALLRAFGERTGVSVLVNTSFNRAGEPIVRTPADALRCAVAAGLDLLVVDRHLVEVRGLAAGRAA